MARQVTLKLGMAGDVHDVTVVLPDSEPIPWQWGEQFSLLRKETPRVDGALKACGSARYSYDIQMPGMLYGVILRSPYAHAMVRDVDMSEAERQSGVIAALRIEGDEVRFAGQEVAAVAAVSPEVATQALRHIKVEYTPMPFVVDMDKAMAAGAPKVFGSRPNLGDPRGGNRGDVARGLREAAAVHEALYTTPVQTHVSLETHGAVASWKDDELTVWCSTQGVFTVRDDLAVLFRFAARQSARDNRVPGRRLRLEIRRRRRGRDRRAPRASRRRAGEADAAARGRACRHRQSTEFLAAGQARARAPTAS